MDIIRRKEEFGFELKENPLARMVNLLQMKVVNPVLAESMDNLAEYQSLANNNRFTDCGYSFRSYY